MRAMNTRTVPTTWSGVIGCAKKTQLTRMIITMALPVDESHEHEDSAHDLAWRHWVCEEDAAH
jgi:hypothetical protein